MNDEPTSDAPPTEDPGLLPGGLPSRGAYVLAFLSVVLAGVFGAVIGYGLGDLSVDGGSTGRRHRSGWSSAARSAPSGVGVVAVLVLRAMAEWQRGGQEAPAERCCATR